MARPLRLELEHGIYHVLARGNEHAAIYRDDADRNRFCELLADLREEYRFRFLAYCLMSNHYHLLVQTLDANLARGMRQLNGVYAQWFNRRHGRIGHLLQGRYVSRLVQADEHLLVVARYIVRNPVRAGLCRSPRDWRWSSHRAALGEVAPGFLDCAGLLAYYGRTLDSARKSYAEHVEHGDDLASPASHPLIEGDDGFVEDVLAGLRPAPGVPLRYLQPPRLPLAALLGEEPDGEALRLALDHGYSLRQIGAHLGVNASTVSRRLRRCRETPAQQKGPDPALRAVGATDRT